MVGFAFRYHGLQYLRYYWVFIMMNCQDDQHFLSHAFEKAGTLQHGYMKIKTMLIPGSG